MSYSPPLSSPIYEGIGTSAEAGSSAPVALGGRAFGIDYSVNRYAHATERRVRQQADTSDAPGEQSINPEGPWLRSGESWHAGSGQRFFDRKTSNPYRFRESKGIYAFDQWHLSLLHDTELLEAATASNLQTVTAGTYLYFVEGNALKYKASLAAAETAVTESMASDPVAIATDGYHVWVACGTDGVWRTTRGAATAVKVLAGTVNGLGYALGRVVAFAGPNLYDVTAELMVNPAPGSPAALPTVLFTHPNIDWAWTSVCEGQNFIYVTGHSGERGTVYKVGIDDDGVTLLPPSPAMPSLPDGETPLASVGYLGFVILGTSLGLRFTAISGQDGGLNVGAVVEGPPVTCFEGQDRFIWYGWSDFDGTHTGLGRIDLQTFGDPDRLVPAYASDLMFEGQGDVSSIVTYEGKTVFSVVGDGLVVESDDLVEQGWLRTGEIVYSMAEPKVGLSLNLNADGPGTKGLAVSYNGDTETTIGSNVDAEDDRNFALNQERIKRFEFKIVLNRDGTLTTEGPTLNSWLMRALPASSGSMYIEVPLLISPTVVNQQTGTKEKMDTISDYSYIASLFDSQRAVRWQEGRQSWLVTVDGFEFFIHELHLGARGQVGYSGTCVVKLKVVT